MTTNELLGRLEEVQNLLREPCTPNDRADARARLQRLRQLIDREGVTQWRPTVTTDPTPCGDCGRPLSEHVDGGDCPDPEEETMPATLHLSREERNQARRAINRLFSLRTREFPSDSDPGRVYTAVIRTDGRVFCNCRGWTIKKKGQPRNCKHTTMLLSGPPDSAHPIRTHVSPSGEFLVVDNPKEVGA